jgi:hypothetical protein
MPSEEEVKGIKRRNSYRLLQEPGVCGVGVEKNEQGKFVLTVHLDMTQPNPGANIPDFIEGCPVKRVKSGPFTKQATG